MNKTGMVYRHVAEMLLENRRTKFVEREIARHLCISPDTVSGAIRPLKRIGVAVMHRTYFEILDLNKLLVFWAVNRKFERDVIYEAYIQIRDIAEIEDRLPGGIAYTGFSAYVKTFGNDAATYSEVYAYATEQARVEVARRFKTTKMRSGYHNLILLKPDSILEEKIERDELAHSSVSIPQMYVDLWNNNTWYAVEFIRKLEKRIGDRYAKAILE